MVAEAIPKLSSSDQSVKYASDYTHVVNWQNSSWHVFKTDLDAYPHKYLRIYYLLILKNSLKKCM